MGRNFRGEGEPVRGKKLSLAEQRVEELKRKKRLRNLEKKQAHISKDESNKEWVSSSQGRCDFCEGNKDDVFPYLVEELTVSVEMPGQRIANLLYRDNMRPHNICGDCIVDLRRKGVDFKQLPLEMNGEESMAAKNIRNGRRTNDVHFIG
jgi:hypothetical protein